MAADIVAAAARGRMQAAPATGLRRGLSVWSDRHIGWLLVAPAVALIAILSIYPLLYSLWVSFVNYDFLVPGHAFVGFANFAAVIADPVARSALLTTVLLSAACVGVEFVLGLALALFAVIFMMTGGGPGTSTYAASYYLYQIGFAQFHLSAATAGSWMFLILVGAAIALLVRRLLRLEAA